MAIWRYGRLSDASPSACDPRRRGHGASRTSPVAAGAGVRGQGVDVSRPRVTSQNPAATTAITSGATAQSLCSFESVTMSATGPTALFSRDCHATVRAS